MKLCAYAENGYVALYVGFSKIASLGIMEWIAECGESEEICQIWLIIHAFKYSILTYNGLTIFNFIN